MGNVINNNSLIFNRSDELTYTGEISGTGTLTKSGAGNLILTGTNNYSGATTVSAGTLSVNGSITSAVTVEDGATLGGTGTVGQTTISSGGTHAPGNSIGTQTIIGNYTLGNGSVLEIEVDSAGNSDKVIVNGTVDITGSTLNVKGVADNNFSGDATYSYIIIENDGADAVIGDFATIDNDLAFYEAATSSSGGDGNDVSLTLTRNASSYTDIAQTRNQKAVANQISNLSGSDGSTIKNAILGLTTEMTLHAYDQLSGDIYAATPEISNRIVRQANGQISARLADLQHNRNVTGTLVAANALSPAQLAGFTQSGPVASDNTTYGSDAPMLSLGTKNIPRSPSAIWVQTIGATGQIDGDGNTGTIDYKWTGMIGGYDTHLSDATVLGVYFGYADAENRQSDRDATLDSGNLMAGIYGTHDLGDDLRLYGQAGWTRIAVDSSRNLDFGGIDRTATADYTDTAINAEIELAKGFDLSGNWRYEPYGGLGLQWNDYDSFEESGAGSANLSRSSDHTLTGTTRIGLRVAGMFKTDNDQTLIPQFRLGWDHHLGQTTNSTTLAFSGTSSFTVTGTDTDRDTLTGNIGVALADPDGWSLYANYQPSLSKNSTEHAFAAGYRMIF
ncbi:autotransporter domain-containing protein [Thalassospira alkalitolerans]|uniref:autotransporter family protein n=1 Tax=Thalassospira alkalitolerans TaxID=1293890 RepID=UPI003AA80C54